MSGVKMKPITQPKQVSRKAKIGTLSGDYALGLNDPVCCLCELADRSLQSMTNEEIDQLLYDKLELCS